MGVVLKMSAALAAFALPAGHYAVSPQQIEKLPQLYTVDSLPAVVEGR